MPNPTPIDIVREELTGDRFHAIARLTLRYAIRGFLMLGVAAVFIVITFFICDALLYPIIGDWATALFIVTVLSGVGGAAVAAMNVVIG